MRALGFLLAVCALVATGCGGEREAEEQPPPAGGPTQTITATKRPPAPDIEGVTLEGERISLSDFRGRAVFVNVWSSW